MLCNKCPNSFMFCVLILCCFLFTPQGEHPCEDDMKGGLYEAMRKELRNAVEEMRTEFEQVYNIPLWSSFCFYFFVDSVGYI